MYLNHSYFNSKFKVRGWNNGNTKAVGESSVNILNTNFGNCNGTSHATGSFNSYFN